MESKADMTLLLGEEEEDCCWATRTGLGRGGALSGALSNSPFSSSSSGGSAGASFA